jgi:hypothetical protein
MLSTSRSSVVAAPPVSNSPSELKIPDSAKRGLSIEFQQLWEERAKRGSSLPVIYSNPGAYVQLNRVSKDVLYALPPPAKPIWPVKESEFTWKYLKAFSASSLIVLLALYLYAKSKIQGYNRLYLERNYPWLTWFLSSGNVIADLSHLDASLDRKLLFGRIFDKYSMGKKAIPRGVFDQISLAILAGGGDASAAKCVPEELTKEVFVSTLEAHMSSISSAVLYLSVLEICSIAAASATTMSILGDLYDRVKAERVPGDKFSARALTELSKDLGFNDDAVSIARDAVLDSMGGRAFPLESDDSLVVPISKREFVDFLTEAAAAGQLEESRLEEYVKVFYLLHMSGMREAAGLVVGSGGRN